MDRLAYKNKIEIQKKFAENFESNIAPYLRGHEVLRKKLYKKYILILWVPICVLLLLWVACWFWLFSLEAFSSFFPMLFVFNIFGFPICFLIAVAIASRFNKGKEFALELKKTCLQKLISPFGDITWENNKGVIESSELCKNGLFSNFTRRLNDDGFHGTYNDVNFKLSETKLQVKVSSKGSGSYIDIFSGLIFEFDLKNPVNSRTIVSTKGGFASFNGTYTILMVVAVTFLLPVLESIINGNFDFAIGVIVVYIVIALGTLIFENFNSKNASMQKVSLEDVELSKEINVYSDDQVEAGYLVTSSFVEKILNLKTVFGARSVKCAFCGNKLVFAIATKENLFEIGKFNKPLLEIKTFKKIYEEITAIYEMIDYFKGVTRKYIEYDTTESLINRYDKLHEEFDCSLRRSKFQNIILNIAVVAFVSSPLLIPAFKHYYNENINIHKNTKRWHYSDNPYINKIAPKIRKNWNPPKSSNSYKVVVLFQINRDGELISSKVTQSSGLYLADKAALNAIRNSAPYPKYKENDGYTIIPIEYTFNYNYRVAGLED